METVDLKLASTHEADVHMMAIEIPEELVAQVAGGAGMRIDGNG